MHEQPSHPVSAIQVDPDSILPASTTSQFRQLHDQYQDVFNPQYEGYNGAAGKYEAVVNMGSSPASSTERTFAIVQQVQAFRATTEV